MTTHRIAIPALVTAAAFAAMSAITFADAGTATREPGRVSASDVPLPVGKVLPADGDQAPVPAPAFTSERPVAPVPSPSSAPSAVASESPSASPTAVPRATRNAKHRKHKKSLKSRLREELEQVVPGLNKLPDWALPIVDRANEDKAPNTTVRVTIDRHGNLIIRAKLLKGKKRTLGFSVVSLRTVEPGSVDVRIVVQDPTQATKETPTSITVTATDPVTESTVTTTAEVTAPAEVTTVTESTVTATVQEAATPTELGTTT